MDKVKTAWNHPFTKGVRKEVKRRKAEARLPKITPREVAKIPMSVWTGVDPPDLAAMGINLIPAEEAEQQRQDMAAQGTLRIGPGAPVGGEVLNTVQRQRKREGSHADGSHPVNAPSTGGAGTGANYEDRLYDAIGTLTSAITTMGAPGGGPAPGVATGDTEVASGLTADFVEQQIRTTGDISGGGGTSAEEREKLNRFGANRFLGEEALQTAANANAQGQFRGHKGLKDESQWVLGQKFALSQGYTGAIARGSSAGVGGACPPGHICWTSPSQTDSTKFQTYSLALYDLDDGAGGCAMPGTQGCSFTGSTAARTAEGRAQGLIHDLLTDDDLGQIGIHGGTSDPGVVSAEEAAYYIGGIAGGVGSSSEHWGGLGYEANYRGTSLSSFRGVLQGHLAQQARATAIVNPDGSKTYHVPTMSQLQFKELAVLDATRRKGSALTAAETTEANTQAMAEYSGYVAWWHANGAFQSGSEQTRTDKDDYVAGGIQEGEYAGVWVRMPDGTYSYAPNLPDNDEAVAQGHGTDFGVTEGFGSAIGASRPDVIVAGDVNNPHGGVSLRGAVYDQYGRCVAQCPTVRDFGLTEIDGHVWRPGYGGAEWNTGGGYDGAYSKHAVGEVKSGAMDIHRVLTHAAAAGHEVLGQQLARADLHHWTGANDYDGRDTFCHSGASGHVAYGGPRKQCTVITHAARAAAANAKWMGYGTLTTGATHAGRESYAQAHGQAFY
tara:strand:+ start:1773 stop:3941 length:2169 start_codon:yes stop_codon:yes gene_type:complete